MARDIPLAGLQLEEDYTTPTDHLPTQAFILDLSDDVIDGMIEAVSKGNEIRLSLGNTPTLLYGSSSHHIEPTFEDDTDDIELYLADGPGTLDKAQRLPQFAMSLFRRPELNGPRPYYRTSSDEDEDEEYEEIDSASELEDSDQQYDEELDSDIALLRTSMAQMEAEKIEKSARVIEKGATTSTGVPSAKRPAGSMGSMQKALSGRHSPFGRASLSPHPSPSLSAVRSPSLAPVDAASSQASDRARQARSPIIHELAFKQQPYDILWQKYPGSSEAEFKNALDTVADLDVKTHNYTLRRKYWRELDAWNHDYASDEERQLAIENAIRQYDKMRLSTNEPEWERLLHKDERGQGRILSKIQATIAKGPAAPKPQGQKSDDGAGSVSGSSTKDDSGGNRSGSSHADDEGADSDSAHSPPGQSSAAAAAVAAAKRAKARELQEKRLLSTKKKTPVPSPSAKVSPAKSASSRASNEKQTKYKSKEFISDSDTTDSESESAPLASALHHSKKSGSDVKPPTTARTTATKAARTASPSPAAPGPPRRNEGTAVAAPGPVSRSVKPSPKGSAKREAATKSLSKKRMREQEDDDSSGSSSSGTPLSKRIRPLKPIAKAISARDPEKRPQTVSRPPQQTPSRAANLISPGGSSNSSGSGSGSGSRISSSGGGGNATTSAISSGTTVSSTKTHKAQTSPAKSSPLASSPPTNASDMDLSSEESVPPIGNSSTAQKRKYVEDRRNNMLAAADASSNKPKKRRPLPNDLVDKALRFKNYYEKYLALYKDISSRADAPKEKVDDLIKMHHRLQDMKNHIHSEALMARA